MKLYNVIIIILAVLVIVGASLEYHSTTSNDPNTIKVAYLPTDHSAALLFAKHNKTYENNGLNVKTVQISSGSNIVDAVASGDVDVGYVGITPAMQGISKGIPIKVVGAVNMVGSGIVVQPNSTITSPADLKDKKIATPGVSSIQQVLLIYELQKYNITQKDVDLISMNVFNIPSALAAKKVDAYISYEPFVSIAPYRGIGQVLMYSDDILEDHPCCVIIAREDFIEQNPQKLNTFLQIHKNSTEYVNTHLNNTANILTQELTTNPEVEMMSLQHIRFVYSVDEGFQDNVLRFMNIEINMGYLKSNLTTNQIFDTQFLGG
jgi:NitT/TauT family transport system substrate-binding protein